MVYRTLGGRVTCTQCSALSKRTRQRCGNPAMKGKTKCKHHGGLSRAASAEGKARQIKANTIHGNETRAKREERKQTNAELYALEKEMRRLGMVEGAWVNRKPPTN